MLKKCLKHVSRLFLKNVTQLFLKNVLQTLLKSVSQMLLKIFLSCYSTVIENFSKNIQKIF